MWRWKLANWILKDELRINLAYAKRCAEKNLILNRTPEQMQNSFEFISRCISAVQKYAE